MRRAQSRRARPIRKQNDLPTPSVRITQLRKDSGFLFSEHHDRTQET